MSEEKTIEAGNSLPQPLGSAAFSVWSEARGVWPRLTHEEIFRAGWDAAIAAATAHVKDQALTTDEIAAAMRRDLLPNPLFGIESEKRRADVMANNCKWLVDKIDRIHDALCPDICGTWQQRATDAVAEAQKARKQMDELHACLKEAMEWCKPCNYEHEPWVRWAKARDSYKPNPKGHRPE